MPDRYFDITDEAPNGGRYVGSVHTAGPWNPQLAHGGPPSALLVRAAERLAAHEAGRRDLIALRYAGEFVGPVPVGEVEVAARVVRIARSAVLVNATLSGSGRVCLDARIWLVRDADTGSIGHPPRPIPAPSDALPGLGLSFPYGDSIDWRAEQGSLVAPGPAVFWARPTLSLIEDEPTTGLARVCLIGDSASGISAELGWEEWTFLNIDLDVHLARPVEGDWLRLDAATQLGAHGSAMTRSTIADTAGVVGCTAQTLVLTPRSVG